MSKVCLTDGVIQICTYADNNSNSQTTQPSNSNGNQVQPSNGNSSSQPTNQVQPSQNQNNQTSNQNNNQQRQFATGTTQIINNNGTIINISNSSVYIYNLYFGSKNQNTVSGSSANQTFTVVSPNYVPQKVVNQSNVASDFAKFVGAIKQNDPVQFALAKINFNKAYVNRLLASLQDKFTHIDTYERKKGNEYQYSINATGDNVKIQEWLKTKGNKAEQSINIQLKKTEVKEWIKADVESKKVEYSLEIKTPKYKLEEYFKGTKADYTYSYSFDRLKGGETQSGKVKEGNQKGENNQSNSTPVIGVGSNNNQNGKTQKNTNSGNTQNNSQTGNTQNNNNSTGQVKTGKLQAVTIGSAHKEGNKFIITPNENYQHGAVWIPDKVDLTKNFTLKANLYLGNRPQGADGIAFVIQNSPQGRNALGGTGGALGYSGISNSIAVEFDTWKNSIDINGNHIGFDENGSLKSIKAYALPQPLESGKEIPVTIQWKYLGNNKGKLIVHIFGKTYEQTYENINKIFGGHEAYIGFTGGTGAERNLQYVSNVELETEKGAIRPNSVIQPVFTFNNEENELIKYLLT